MVVSLNSSQVQQNFGATLDQAARGEDVVIERYGAPRAVMIEYGRYRRLMDAEQEHALGEAGMTQVSAPGSERAAVAREAAAPYRVARGQPPALEPLSARRQPAVPDADVLSLSYRYVARTLGLCGGRPILRGTRISVRTIVGYHQLGMSADAILAELPHLTPAQVYEALSYYYDHVDEIEREIEEDRLERLIGRYGFPGSRVLGELEAVLKSLSPLNAAEAEGFASDLADARAQLPQETPRDPWAS